MNWLILGMEAPTTVLTEIGTTGANVADGGAWWKSTALVLLGMVLIKGIEWAAGWIDGKGSAWVQERLTKLQDKVNSNEVLAQIQADDAVFSIMKAAIPEVFNELSETVKRDLKDGKLDTADWADIGKRIWARSKDQIEGGGKDYLKESSFKDGQFAAEWVLKKTFNKIKAKKEGLND